MSRDIKLDKQIDSIDVWRNRIVVSLSNLEGNEWSGSLLVLEYESLERSNSLSCDAGVSMARFANSGLSIVAARDDGQIIMYSDTLEELRRFAAHDDIISAVDNSPINYSQFVSVGWDGIINVWDWRSSNPETPIYIAESRHGIIYDVSYNSFSNSDILCTVAKDGYLRVWDTRIRSAECSQIFELGQIGNSVLWADENLIVTGLEDGRLAYLDSRYPATPVDVNPIHNGAIRRLRKFTDLPNTIFCASQDTTVSVTTLHMSNTVPDESTPPHALPGNNIVPRVTHKVVQRINQHTDYVTDVVWVPSNSSSIKDTDAGSVVTSSWDKRIAISPFIKQPQ